MSLTVAVLAFDGCDELDVVGPAEVFRMADCVDCRIANLDGREWVTGSHGLRIGTEPEVFANPDIIVVPGGNWLKPRSVGTHAEIEKGLIADVLSSNVGSIVVGVCTGSMVLADAGLLDGIEATTHASALGNLESRGVTVVRQRVVDAGSVVTCGGVTSGIDAALWVVEREVGPPAAARIAATLEYPRWTGDPGARPGAQVRGNPAAEQGRG